MENKVSLSVSAVFFLFPLGGDNGIGHVYRALAITSQ